MSQNLSATKPALLLAGFILMSALVHSIFLASCFDEQSKSINIMQIAPPLQVVVISSRGSQADDPQKTLPAETKKKTPVHKTTPATQAIRAIAKQAVQETPPPTPVIAKQELKDKPDKTQSMDISSTKTNSSSNDKSKSAPVNHLRAQLRSQLARHFIYPRLARRMGWEGQVGLELHIEEDGSLHKIRVVRSSGYKVLDENARSTLNSIGRITVASNMIIDPVDTEIEVQYRLTE